MTNPRTVEHTEAFAELGRTRFSETDLPTALANVAEPTVPGADDVLVTLVGAGSTHTAEFAGQRATTVDEWQYQQGHGPCPAAADANITVTVRVRHQTARLRRGRSHSGRDAGYAASPWPTRGWRTAR
jgi:hypothetical protein